MVETLLDMRSTIARSILLVVFLSSFIGAAHFAVAAEPQLIEIDAPTDASELARGFEGAFNRMSASRVVIFVRMEERIQKIQFIRNVRASAGVLVLEMRDSNIIAVDARRILLMTDGKMEP